MAQTVDMRGILLANLTSPIFASNYKDGNRPTGVNAWRIAAPYRADTSTPMVAAHPRVSDAHADSAWKWLSTKFDNTIRLVWRGGEPPYRITMNTYPAGTTIGNTAPIQTFTRTLDGVVAGVYRHSIPEGYATLKIPGASLTNGNTYNFSVTVTDQNDNEIDFDFSSTASDSKFKYFDSVNGNNANTGTFESPFQTFLHGYNLSGAGGFIYAYKNGTYTVTDGSANAGMDSSHCRSHIGIGTNRDSVIFNMSSGLFSGAVSDFTIKNATLTGAPAADGNPKLIKINGKSDRLHVHNCKFNTSVGTDGGDNPCGIWLPDIGTATHDYVTVVDCELASTSTASLAVYFSCQYRVEENCTAVGIVFPQANGSLVTHDKGRGKNNTYRFLNYSAESENGIIWISNQNPEDCNNIELVYSRINNIITGNAAIRWNGQVLTGTRPAGQLTLRCSVSSDPTDPYAFESYVGGSNVSFSGILFSSSVATAIDTTGGASLTTTSVKVSDVDSISAGNLGIRGCVMASTEVV